MELLWEDMMHTQNIIIKSFIKPTMQEVNIIQDQYGYDEPDDPNLEAEINIVCQQYNNLH